MMGIMQQREAPRAEGARRNSAGVSSINLIIELHWHKKKDAFSRKNPVLLIFFR